MKGRLLQRTFMERPLESTLSHHHSLEGQVRYAEARTGGKTTDMFDALRIGTRGMPRSANGRGCDRKRQPCLMGRDCHMICFAAAHVMTMPYGRP